MQVNATFFDNSAMLSVIHSALILLTRVGLMQFCSHHAENMQRTILDLVALTLLTSFTPQIAVE